MIIIKQRSLTREAGTLTRFVARARRAVGLSGTVHVLVTDSREMRSLNRRFRRKNRATDVLSFPAMDSPLRNHAGDVAISAGIAAQNARRLGHSLLEEIKILTLHGLLHLAGYDHEQDDGAMARKEQRLRKSLGLPVGLIERAGESARIRSASKRGGVAQAKRRAHK